MQSAHSLSHLTPHLFVIQIDSLIYEKNIDYDMTQLDLLVLYEEALSNKHADSVNIFKKLAILNAELEQPKDAYIYTNKYINNTLDLSILKNESYNSIRETKEYVALSEKYMTNINVLAFIYFYAALIGFFFSVTISLTKRTNKYAKVFIAIFVSANSLFILEFVLYMTNYQYYFPHTYRMSAAAALLFGPLLYFYFKSAIQEYTFKSLDLLHFMPTVILLVFLFPLYTLSSEEKTGVMLETRMGYTVYDVVIFISKVISLVTYAFLSGKMLLKDSKAINRISSDNSVLIPKAKWKRNIYRIHIAYVASYLLYGISVFGILGSISSFMYHMQIGAMSVIVIYIAYVAYVQPSVFKEAAISQKVTNNKIFLEKYQKSGLTEALSKELKDNLIKLLVEDKIYKENTMNLDILADKLNTTRHNTSQIINEHFKMNFFELINKFRIQEAINLLKEDVHGNLNIIDVAYEVGYNNKVTFNKAFKKETSLTPSEFINSEYKNNIKVNFE